MNCRCIAAIVLIFLSGWPIAGQADWLGFRGTDTNSVADSDGPGHCDDADIAWSAALPGRGVSSPIVVGNQVIVTASSGVKQDRLHVISIDVDSGKERWHRQFWATGRTATHPSSANAAPTPVSDGEHIVAFFSSNDVVCLGLDGDLKWFRGLAYDYPKAGNDIGMASSPVLASGVVVCQAENQGDSFAEGIDVTSGKVLWRVARPVDSNWTSPVCLPSSDRHPALVVLKSDLAVVAYDLRSGEEVWKIDGEVGGVPSMVVSDDHVYVPGSTFTVLAQTNDGASVSWESQRIKASTSPIVHNGRIYTMTGSVGILACFDATTGDTAWQQRVGGKYWASPVLAGDFIYVANQEGELNILDRESGKKIDSHTFGHEIMGTPAVAGGALYVRAIDQIWKVNSR